MSEERLKEPGTGVKLRLISNPFRVAKKPSVIQDIEGRAIHGQF